MNVQFKWITVQFELKYHSETNGPPHYCIPSIFPNKEVSVKHHPNYCNFPPLSIYSCMFAFVFIKTPLTMCFYKHHLIVTCYRVLQYLRNSAGWKLKSQCTLWLQMSNPLDFNILKVVYVHVIRALYVLHVQNVLQSTSIKKKADVQGAKAELRPTQLTSDGGLFIKVG